MKRLTAIAIAIISICGIYQEAHAKGSSGGRGGFSSSRSSFSSFRSTSSSYSKSSNYTPSSTVNASKWSWNTPSPAPTKPAYQPPKVVAPTTYAATPTKLTISPPKPAYVPKPVVVSPKPTYTYVPPVVPRRETKEVRHYHNNGGADLATVAITAAAITAMSNNSHASQQPQQIVINTQEPNGDVSKTVVVSNQGLVSTPKEKPIKFEIVNDCDKWVCD